MSKSHNKIIFVLLFWVPNTTKDLTHYGAKTMFPLLIANVKNKLAVKKI
jgi:hypothetical protein